MRAWRDTDVATRSAVAGWLHRVSDSDVWWSFKSSPMTVTAAAVTLFIVAAAFLSPVLAPHTPFDPATLSLSDGLKPPRRSPCSSSRRPKLSTALRSASA